MSKQKHFSSWEITKRELLRDKRVRTEYEQSRPQFEIACQIIELRQRHNLTQRQLAEKIGTSQSDVARLESLSHLPSISTLHKIASATGARLTISLIG